MCCVSTVNNRLPATTLLHTLSTYSDTMTDTDSTPPPVSCIPCLVSVSLTGEWLPGVEQYERELTAGYEEDGGGGLDMNLCPRNIQEMRQIYQDESEYDSPHRVSYMDQCHCETIIIDATHYGGSLPHMKITVNKVKGVHDQDRAAFIYFHGGA